MPPCTEERGGCSALKLKVGMRAPMCVKSLGKCARTLKKKVFLLFFWVHDDFA